MLPIRLPSLKTIILLLVLATFAPKLAAYMVADSNVSQNVEASTSCFYVVRYGDTLFRIGLRYGVSYYYLSALNGIPNPNLVYAGSVLSVPCAPYARPRAPVPSRPCAPSQTHMVIPGDTLFHIAMTYGTTVDRLRAANGLYGRALRPGRQLIIPCPGSVKYRQVPTPVVAVEQPTAEPVQPTTAPPQATAPAAKPTTAPAQTPVQPAGEPNTVRMKGGKFRPANLTVKVGTTVMWKNTEDAGGPSYTVTSGAPGAETGVFTSGDNPIPPGGTFSWTFTTAGNYDYFSRTKPDMTGSIHVTP